VAKWGCIFTGHENILKENIRLAVHVNHSPGCWIVLAAEDVPVRNLQSSKTVDRGVQTAAVSAKPQSR
jgi:hypothetical protein